MSLYMILIHIFRRFQIRSNLGNSDDLVEEFLGVFDSINCIVFGDFPSLYNL